MDVIFGSPQQFHLSQGGKPAYIGSTAFCELDAHCKDFNEYRRKGGHWDIMKIKKYQIKEDLLHLPFTHTFFQVSQRLHPQVLSWVRAWIF